VLVTIQYDVHAMPIQHLPERPHRSVRSVLGSRGPARVVPVRKLASVAVRPEVAPDPPELPVRDGAAA
jgi:hypothetical protein